MSDAAEEANILHPDETVEVGGYALRVTHIPTQAMEVQVREFTFGQELELEAVAAPVIEAMGELTDSKPEVLDWNGLVSAAAKHPEALKRMVSAATGLTAEQLDAMKAKDGRMVLITFFRVNWDFFLDRLVVRSGTRVTRDDMKG